MKKLCSLMVGVLLILCLRIPVQATETKSYNGQINALIGPDTISSVTADYNLSDHFGIVGEFHDNGWIDSSNTYTFKAGLFYRNSDTIKLTLGERYDFNPHTNSPFGRLDFSLPFGDSLKIIGYCDQNYYINDWTRYEAAFRIQVFEGQSILAGVRGDIGSGAPTYDYNPEREAYLFLKGDFNLQSGKFEFNVHPLLYIRGVLFNDYAVKYNLNQQTALLIKWYSDYYQREYLLAGIQWKL